MEVSRDFVHLGKSVAVVLARVGLPAEALIKIKRKPSAVVATSASISLPGAMRTGACGGRSTSSNSGSPDCGKRAGEGWGSKVDGSPVASNVSSPSARKHPSGTESGPLTTLSKPQHQASSLPHDFGIPAEEEPPFSDDVVDQRTARKDENDRFDAICPVSPLEPLLDGDALVLSCPRSTMISFQGSVLSECVRGLEILGATAEQLQRVALSAEATSFFELVLSDRNHFVGRCPSGQDGALLASRYNCRVVAVRHVPTVTAVDKTQNTEEEEEQISMDEIGRTTSDKNTGDRYIQSHARETGGESVNSPLHGGERRQSAVSSAAMSGASPGRSEAGAAAKEYRARGVEAAARPLGPGDVVLALAKAGFLEKWKDAAEFDLVTQVGAVPKAVSTYDYLSLLVFCGMLAWVLFSSVAMVSQGVVWRGVAWLRKDCEGQVFRLGYHAARHLLVYFYLRSSWQLC